MSFVCVIVGLRARGFQIFLADLYSFYVTNQIEARTDSCGIFCIGPWTGVRMVYDCGLFEIPPPTRTTNNSLVLKESKVPNGKVIGWEQQDMHVYDIPVDNKVQGYVLTSYLPKTNDANKKNNT